MEIDLRGKKPWLYLTLGLVALAALALIGRAFTPAGGGFLTAQEWQILQAQQAYNAELNSLHGDAGTLQALLDQQAQPARAQVVAGEVRSRLALGGLETLALQRQALDDAALAVLDWAAGLQSLESAQAALDAARSLLDEESALSNLIYLPVVKKDDRGE